MQMTGIFAINFFALIFLTSVSVFAYTSYISSMAVGYTNFIMVILGVLLVGQYRRRGSVAIFCIYDDLHIIYDIWSTAIE